MSPTRAQNIFIPANINSQIRSSIYETFHFTLTLLFHLLYYLRLFEQKLSNHILLKTRTEIGL